MPDELEILPDGPQGRTDSWSSGQDRNAPSGGIPIPKTVLQKIDPMSPNHDEVPGTTAQSICAADAVPDVITKLPNPQRDDAGGKGVDELRNEEAIPDFIKKEDSPGQHYLPYPLSTYGYCEEDYLVLVPEQLWD